MKNVELAQIQYLDVTGIRGDVLDSNQANYFMFVR